MAKVNPIKTKNIIGFRPDKEGKDRESLNEIKKFYKFDSDSSAIRFLIRNIADGIKNKTPINILPNPGA